MSTLLLAGRKEFTQGQEAVKDTLSSLTKYNKTGFWRDIVYLRNELFLESLWGKIIEGCNDKKAFVFDQEFPAAVVLAEYISSCNLSHFHHLLTVQDGVEPFRPYEAYDIIDGRPLHKSPRESNRERNKRLTEKQINEILKRLDLPLE